MGYAILNAGYPGTCANAFNWTIVEDKNLKLSNALRANLNIGSPWACSLDRALQYCDRHVYISGTPPNSLPFVQDWVNALRWEVSQLWETNARSGSFERKTTHTLSVEHYMRSGELLAEGLAVQLLCARLGLTPQRFSFIDAQGARPDYAVALKNRHRRRLLIGNQLWFLEVRLRRGDSMLNLSKEERTSLAAKKNRFTGAIAVYVMYGDGRWRKSARPYTRIHIADPIGGNQSAADENVGAESAIRYYLNLTSQIGLWAYRDHLLRALNAVVQKEGYRTKLSEDARSAGILLRRQIGAQEVSGRHFNSLVREYSESSASELTVDAVRRLRRTMHGRMDAGDFGTEYFKGLGKPVLDLIADCNWQELLDYKVDEDRILRHGYAQRSDGVIQRSFLVQPDSPEAQDVRRSIPEPN